VTDAIVTEARPQVETARIYLTVSWADWDNVRVYRWDPDKAPSPIRNVANERGESLPPAYDHEAPLGVRVGYAAVGWDDGQTEPPAPLYPQIYTTLVVPGTETWLTDPGLPHLSLRVSCVTLLPVQTYDASVGLFAPLGRAESVSLFMRRKAWTGSLGWITKDHAEFLAFKRLFERGGPLLLRTGPTYGLLHDYVQPMDVQAAPLKLQSLPHRKWTAPLVVVGPPVGDRPLETGGTYQDAREDYATYQDVKDAFATYYDFALYRPTGP
jgi:hypothetical protein